MHIPNNDTMHALILKSGYLTIRDQKEAKRSFSKWRRGNR